MGILKRKNSHARYTHNKIVNKNEKERDDALIHGKTINRYVN